MKTENKKGNDLVMSCAMAIFGGVAVNTLYPAYAVYGLCMSAVGLFGIVYNTLTWSRFDRLWRNLGLGKGEIYPKLKNTKQGDGVVTYSFTLPCGMCLDDFLKNKEKIEQFIGKACDIKYTYKEIMIDVYDTKVIEKYEFEPVDCKGEVSFPIGKDRKGRLIVCDLSSKEPHMLIAGETGGGKSTAIRSIITNLILTKNVKLHLIDLKGGVELQLFRNCSKVANFARTRSEAEAVLAQIRKEIDRRYALLMENECTDIKEYNRRFGGMGYEVLIIDEFADLKSEKNSIEMVEDVVALARACGIHAVISTQRPDARILNGRIKANTSAILGLKTMNSTNSEIIFDRSGLEKLRGEGHAIFRKGKEIEIQCPYLSPDRARELIAPLCVKKFIAKQETRKDGVVLSYAEFDQT